jgi:hypothetical protein
LYASYHLREERDRILKREIPKDIRSGPLLLEGVACFYFHFSVSPIKILSLSVPRIRFAKLSLFLPLIWQRYLLPSDGNRISRTVFTAHVPIRIRVF